jgi:hypothetical protein
MPLQKGSATDALATATSVCVMGGSVGKRASAGRYSRWDIFNQVQLFTTASLRAFDGSMDI